MQIISDPVEVQRLLDDLKKQRDELLERMKTTGPCESSLIRPDVLVSLQAYVRDHKPVGDFLRFTIMMDLRGAVSRADDYNILTIPAIVAWIYKHCPLAAQGSYEAYREWIKT